MNTGAIWCPFSPKPKKKKKKKTLILYFSEKKKKSYILGWNFCSPKLKKTPIFFQKIFFIYFGMQLAWKTTKPTLKKIILFPPQKNSSHILWWLLIKQCNKKILHTLVWLLIKCKMKKFLILQGDCWLSVEWKNFS